LAIRTDLNSADGPRILNQELKAVQGGERASYWVRVLDSTRRIVAETPGMNRLLPVKLFSPKQTSPLTGLQPRDYQTSGRLFSLVSVVTEANGQPFTIQVAQDRTVDEQFEKQFGLLVAAVLVCGIFASAMIAITVTKRGLRPLGAMTGL
jgi:hypothetical protein